MELGNSFTYKRFDTVVPIALKRRFDFHVYYTVRVFIFYSMIMTHFRLFYLDEIGNVLNFVSRKELSLMKC